MNEHYTQQQRLRAADIAALLAGGQVIKCPGLKVFLKPNTLGIARLGLIVPKRVLRRAVDRNRAKRVLREWFRRHKTLLGSRDLLFRLTGKAFLVHQVVELLVNAA